MWAVRDLAIRTVELDFSSSGQANRAVTQIVIDGAVFANAAELSSWDDTRVTGPDLRRLRHRHCASGGWLVARNVGVGVAFIPAFGEMHTGDWERVEYAPPYFAQGMPVFTPTDYAKLRRWCLDLPPIEAVPDLTGDELLRCMQWEAPAPVLGMFPADIQLNQDLLLAVLDALHRLSAVHMFDAGRTVQDHGASPWVCAATAVRVCVVPPCRHGEPGCRRRVSLRTSRRRRLRRGVR